MSQRENQQNNHKDVLNNLIEVSKINQDMTEEILYKTFVQFFGDGYESASQVNYALFIGIYIHVVIIDQVGMQK